MACGGNGKRWIQVNVKIAMEVNQNEKDIRILVDTCRTKWQN